MIAAAILAGAISMTPYQIIDAKQSPIGYKSINGNALVCYLPSCVDHYRITVIAKCKSATRREGFVDDMAAQERRGVIFNAVAVMDWVALDAMFREMDRRFREACEWSA